MLGLTGELEQRPPEKLRLPHEPDRARCLSSCQAATCKGGCADTNRVLEGQEERAA